jgi:uncharacterized protein (DUF433 family)
MESVMQHVRITWDPKIMAGKPVIRGTRVPVETILRWLGKGVTEAELLSEYPGLSHEDILAAQAFAADFLGDERLVSAAE